MFVWPGSSLFRQKLMLRWYLYIKVSLTYILRCNMVTGDDQRCIPAPSSFKTGINNMLLASCNVCKIKMWLHQQFFTYWKDNNIRNTKKQTTKSNWQIWSTLVNVPHSLKKVRLLLLQLNVIFMMIITQLQV